MGNDHSQNIIFHSPTFGKLGLGGVVEKIREFVGEQPARSYKVVIGTDSESGERVSLVSAVTVWRVGNGAIHFWTRSEEKKFATLRERIWQEAINSITLAQEIRSRLQIALRDEFFWDGNEIHVDVGENGPTKELMDGVGGMIKGYNFVPVFKPFAFGASVVADRHT